MLRFVLLIAALIAATLFIAAHGVRAVIILIVVALLMTLPRTRVWQRTEAVLVHLTGSRRRAYVLLMVIFIAVSVGVNVYELVH